MACKLITNIVILLENFFLSKLISLFAPNSEHIRDEKKCTNED